MTCDLLPGAPVCAFPADAQTSDSGKAFYDQIPTIAKTFAVGIDTAIPLSGIHYWNQDSQPASAAEWTEPVFIMGGVSFHSNVVLSWDFPRRFTDMQFSCFSFSCTDYFCIYFCSQYGGSVVFSEPMLPIEMVTGSVDRTFSETIEYEGENIPGLPTKYDYEYDGTTGYLTITAEGKAADCVLGEPDTTTSGASVVKTIQAIIIMSLVVTLYF